MATVLLVITIAALVVALLVTRWQRNLARAQWDLAAAESARLQHKLETARRDLADVTWSRDQALLDNAALRGENGIEVPA